MYIIFLLYLIKTKYFYIINNIYKIILLKIIVFHIFLLFYHLNKILKIFQKENSNIKLRKLKCHNFINSIYIY